MGLKWGAGRTVDEGDVAQVVPARGKVVEVLEVVGDLVRRGIVGAAVHVKGQARIPRGDVPIGGRRHLGGEGGIDVEAKAVPSAGRRKREWQTGRSSARWAFEPRMGVPGVVVEDVAFDTTEGAREDADLAIGGADAEVALPLVVDVEGVHVADDPVGQDVVGGAQGVDGALVVKGVGGGGGYGGID